MKILHTADWQLGRQYSRFAPVDCAPLSEARFSVLSRLRTLCEAHAVDAMLVAGDVFDAQDLGDTALRRGFLQLEDFPCPVVLLPGNHDADVPGGIFERAQLLGLVPPQVILAREPEPILLCQDRLWVLPAPLKRRQEAILDLAAWRNLHGPVDAFRVGLAHGSVRGVLPENYATANLIDLADIAAAALDYVALGDWHGVFQVNSRVFYSGTPEPDRFRNNESGYALLVSLSNAALPVVEKIPVATYQWHDVALQFDALRGLTALRELAEFGADAVLRLRLSGEIGASDDRALRLAIAALRAKVRAVSVDDSALKFAPTEAELRAFVQSAGEGGGALAQLVEELTSTLDGADAKAQQVAMDALRLLLELHLERTQ